MIWGLILEPGQVYTEVIEDEVQLSMATMESRGCIGSKVDSFSHVVLKTDTTEYLLCTLVNGVTYQQSLDLKLMPSDKVTFSVQGTNVVYLTGYSYITTEATMQDNEWIEEPMLDEEAENVSELDASYLEPSNEEENIQETEDATSITDEGRFTLQYEVPSEDVGYQAEPEQSIEPPGAPRQPQGSDDPLSVARIQPLQPGSDVPTTVIKQEINTVVESDIPSTMDQPMQRLTDVGGQPTPAEHTEAQSLSIHLPSTSAGKFGRSKLESRKQPHSHSVEYFESFPVGQIDGAKSDLPHEHMYIHLQGQSEHADVCAQSVGHLPSGRATGRYQQLTYQTTHTSSLGGRKSNIRQSKPASIAKRLQTVKVQKLQQHRDKTLKCRFCDMRFEEPGEARRHEEVHVGDRPYPCRHCSKAFRGQDSRKKHERTHTGERPYTCELCQRTYIQNSHLRTHQRKQHNRIPTRPCRIRNTIM